MALVIGTNCGLVTEAPDADPSATGVTADNVSRNIRIATTDAVTITSIGWWCNTATEESNFEVGIYEDDGGVASTLLHVSRTHAKGTDAGWKRVTGLSWGLEADTTYHIAFQVDDTASTTQTDYDSTNDTKTAIDYTSPGGRQTLTEPWTDSSTDPTSALALYAVWEEAAAGVEHEHAASDTLSMSDSLATPVMTFNVALDDTLSLSDGFGAAMTFKQALSDTLSISDSMAPVMTFKQALADTMNLSDSMAPAMTFEVALADTLNISDSILAAAVYKVALSDTLEMSDSLSYEAILAAIKKMRGMPLGLRPARVSKIGRIGI